jgi:thiol-disulfide isomerase/thioredoxin
MKILPYILMSMFFISLSTQCISQNTLVIGKLVNTSMVNKIELKVDERYINGGSEMYQSNVLSDHTFAFAVQIDRPQKVKLIYSRNEIEIYLEPNDTLYIEGDANTFPFNLTYGGRGGYNNTFLKKFKKEFPKHNNHFEYVQYRSGLYWYQVPPDIDAMMQRQSKTSYAESMAARKTHRLAALEKYNSEHPQKLTKLFREYMFTEIYYEYGYYMLCYGDIFKNKHYVGKPFFDQVEDIPLQSEQMGSQSYREYTKAYVNHKYMELYNNDVMGIINKQYDLAVSYLSDMPLAYFRSDILAKALYGKKVDVVLDNYNDFLLNNTYYEFNDKITTAYQKAIKYHIGSPAPKFSLITKEGHLASLDELKGKPIFINFWASWCHSCMKKMDKMKELQAEMEEKGIVFLQISFDRSKEQWTETIAKKEYTGQHIFLEGGVSSSLAKDYNVRALPQYYLIDKSGNFAKTPAKGDLLEMREIMERLLR